MIFLGATLTGVTGLTPMPVATVASGAGTVATAGRDIQPPATSLGRAVASGGHHAISSVPSKMASSAGSTERAT